MGDRFEDLLGADGLPRPRPEYRARMREAFLSGEEDGADRKSSSQVPQAPRIRGAMEADLEAALARAPLPRARDAYREQVRGRFLGLEGTEAELGPVSAQRPTRPVSLLRRVVVLTAAAAAFFFVTFFLPRAPRWTVEGIEGGDSIEVAGLELGARELGRIADSLTRGARLDSGEAVVDLGLSQGLQVRVLAGTRLELAELPALGGVEPIVFTLDHGEVFVKTTEGYPGNPIVIETPEQRVHVKGTVLGVMRDEQGTCCCVARGEVEVENLLAGGEVASVGTCHSLRSPRGHAESVLRDWEQAGEDLRAHTAPLLAFASAP